MALTPLAALSIPHANDNVIEVGDLQDISTSGGAIMPSAIVSSVPANHSSVIIARGFLFTGDWGFHTFYVGTVGPDTMNLRTTDLAAIALGGDLCASSIVVDGKISILYAERFSRRYEGSVYVFGGAVGFDPVDTSETMHVVSGADPALEDADIGDVFGSDSVRGDFYAGGDTQYGTLLSAALGMVGTDSPWVYPAPAHRTITGSGWSSKQIDFFGGDHSAFVEHYP